MTMRIAAGDWALTLDPAHGGMVRSLTRQGADILRPSPKESQEPLESACLALAPYVNRIANGRFEWAGSSYHLAPNHQAIAHPLHGTAWLSPWIMREQRQDAVTLAHVHTHDDRWPWPYALEQTLKLTGDGLEAHLVLTNTGSGTMPAGLGFHPWFARAGVEAITFTAKDVWLADDAMLPTARVPADHFADWSKPTAPRSDTLIDNCYTHWNGAVEITRADGNIRLESQDARFLHLFIPPGEDFFCAEPQTTMPDAVNRPLTDEPGLTALSAGGSISLHMRICNA